MPSGDFPTEVLRETGPSRSEPPSSALIFFVTDSTVHHIDTVIRVYDNAGNVIKTHEHAGEFKEP